mgnify:CR=1 FL=1
MNRYSVVCLALGLSSLPAAAAESDGNSDRILVTATRIDPQQTQARGHVTVISAADIERSTARTLPELLGREAGVLSRSLYGNNASRASVDIRGFGAASTQNTLILVDGRRLNDVDLSAVDYSAIPLQAIERIEISRNGGAVLYGDGAVGGTINIITRTPGKAGTSGFARAGAGNLDTRQLDAHVSHNSGAVAMFLGAHGVRSDGYRDHNDLDQRSLNSDLRYSHDNGELFLKAWWDDQELDLPGVRRVDPGAIPPLDELADDRKGSATPNDFADQRGYSLAAGYSHFLDNGAEVVLDLGYRSKNQKALLDDYDFGGLFASYIDSDLETWSVTPRFSTPHDLLGASANTIAGLDYYHSQYDSDRSLNEDNRNRPIHRIDVKQQTGGVYLDTTLQPRDGMHLNLGGRIQWVRVEAKDRVDTTAPGGGFASEAPRYKETDWVEMLEAGIEQQLDTHTAVYLKASRSARIATIDELFEVDPENFLQVFSDLDPQTANGIDIGISHDRGTISGRANLYYMRLKDEIHYDPDTFSNINLDPTRRYGLELSAAVSPLERLDIQASYTRMHAEFRDGPYDGNDVPLVPRHSASLVTTWRQSPATDLTVALNYVANRYFDNDQTNDFGEKIPSYKTVDVQASHVYSGYRFTAKVNNLLADKHYDYGVRSTFSPGVYNAYPLPERTLLFTVSRKFGP